MPTAATPEPAADAAEANHSSRMPRRSRAPSKREDGHHQRIHHEDGDRRLDEDLEPIAAPDGDDAGHPAEEDVGREFERVAVDGPADDGDHRDDDGRDRGVEEDREQDRDRRRRQEERQRRAPGRDLEGERRPDHQQTDQDQDVVAMPEPRPEAPDPRQEDPDRQDREQQPAAEAGHIGEWLTEIEGIDLLDVGRGQLRPVADDDLALADRDQDRLHLIGGLGLGRVRQFGAERGVRDDQRVDELGREHPLRFVEAAGHQPGQLSCAARRPRSRAAACAASRRGPVPPRS